MRFKDYFSLKHILFAVVLFAVLLPFAVRDSNKQVKVSFDNTTVYTSSNRYSLSVDYSQIESAQLVPLAEAGQKVEDGYDDDILRAGKWQNGTWGEYYITADLDTTNCVAICLKDGRLFVFSSKDDATTASLYEELLTHLN